MTTLQWKLILLALVAINIPIVPHIRVGVLWVPSHTCQNFCCHLPPLRQSFISLELTNSTRLVCQWVIGTLLFPPPRCWECTTTPSIFNVGSWYQPYLLMIAKQMFYWLSHLHKPFKIVFQNIHGIISPLKMLWFQTKKPLRTHLDRRKKFGSL